MIEPYVVRVNVCPGCVRYRPLYETGRCNDCLRLGITANHDLGPELAPALPTTPPAPTRLLQRLGAPQRERSGAPLFTRILAVNETGE